MDVLSFVNRPSLQRVGVTIKWLMAAAGARTDKDRYYHRAWRAFPYGGKGGSCWNFYSPLL